MGYLKERHGMMMLPGIAKEGQCRDAMAHCAEAVRASWTRELKRVGVDVDEVPGMGHLGVSVKGGRE